MSVAADRVAQTAEDREGVSSRWYVLIVLFLLAVCSQVDRHIVPILAEPIKREFQLNDTQLAFLSGAAFVVSFTLAGIPLGFLSDRIHRVRLLWSRGGLELHDDDERPGSFLTLVLARIGVVATEYGAHPRACRQLSRISAATNCTPARNVLASLS
jgi:MFS family permease